MTICGLDCCKGCNKFKECGGCEKCEGHPFGGNCVAAETIKKSGMEGFEKLKNTLIYEINQLQVPGLYINDLNLLNGYFVNIEYQDDGGKTVKYLNDNDIYFGYQVEIDGGRRCYGVVANESLILVSEYGIEGIDAKLIAYKKR